MSQTAIELKPCPFCGSPAELEHGSDHHGSWFNLGCSRHWGNVDPDNSCVGGRLWYTETEKPEAEAIAAWNSRALSAPTQGGVKGLIWEYREQPMFTYRGGDERGTLYYINQSFGSDSYYFTTLRGSDAVIIYDGDDLDEAKEAAQQDYNVQHSSKLQSAEPWQSEAKAQAVALSERAGIDMDDFDLFVADLESTLIKFAEWTHRAALSTTLQEPVAYLRFGEPTPVQGVPFGANWITDKDDPHGFPVYTHPPIAEDGKNAQSFLATEDGEFNGNTPCDDPISVQRAIGEAILSASNVSDETFAINGDVLVLSAPDGAIRIDLSQVNRDLVLISRETARLALSAIDAQNADDAYHNYIEAGSELRTTLAHQPVTAGLEHPDDSAVDRFAAAMKAKLAKKREQGFSGWDDPEKCHIDYLVSLLSDQIHARAVIDPIDIGNLAMMIYNRPETPSHDR